MPIATQILNPNKLDQTCMSIIENLHRRKRLAAHLCELLYSTGARCGDILYNPDFIINPNTGILNYIQTKNQIPRAFIVTPRQGKTLTYLAECIEIARSQSYETHTREIKNASPYIRIHTQNKDILTHIFRHNYARKIYSQSSNLNTVKAMIGVSSTAQADIYVNRDISYDYFT